MKLLQRNLTEFEYLPNLGSIEILDGGKHTGRYDTVYGAGVPYKGNIGVPGGYNQHQMFGIVTDYSHVLLMDDPNADIREGGKIRWKDAEYEIRAVVPSLNVLSVALKKITAQSSAVVP